MAWRSLALPGLALVCACSSPPVETVPPPEPERETSWRAPRVRGPTDPPSATDIAETRASAPACAGFLGDPPATPPPVTCADALHAACTGGGPTDEIARVAWWLATDEDIGLAARDAVMWSTAQACSAQLATRRGALALADEQIAGWRAADDPVAVSHCLDRCVLTDDVRGATAAWEAGRGYAARLRAQLEALTEATAELARIDEVGVIYAQLADATSELEARRAALGEELHAEVVAELGRVAKALDAKTAELARAHVATRLAEMARITTALRAAAGQRDVRIDNVEALVDAGESAARSARRVLRARGATLGAGLAKVERKLEKASREMDRAVTAARKAAARAAVRWRAEYDRLAKTIRTPLMRCAGAASAVKDDEARARRGERDEARTARDRERDEALRAWHRERHRALRATVEELEELEAWREAAAQAGVEPEERARVEALVSGCFSVPR